MLPLGFGIAKASEANGRSWRKRIVFEAKVDGERRCEKEQYGYGEFLVQKVTGNGRGLVAVEHTENGTRARRSKREANKLIFIYSCKPAVVPAVKPYSDSFIRIEQYEVGHCKNSSSGRYWTRWDLAYTPELNVPIIVSFPRLIQHTSNTKPAEPVRCIIKTSTMGGVSPPTLTGQ